MRPIIKLEQSARQRLFLSFSLKQSLKILELPLLDLKALIEEELNSNPLLEKIERLPPPLIKKISSKELLLESLPFQKSLQGISVVKERLNLGTM
jgi:DNA-directed RNA polymerase specialized sigma54-like protein